MTKTVNDALAEIQAKIAVPKDRNNSFGGYKYRKAEDIISAARSVAPAGTIIKTSDEICEVAGQIFVIATASITFAGETITADAGAMHPLQKKGMDASQITGSASSYARKYALQGLFALDDGENDPDARDNRQENGNKPPEGTALREKMIAALQSKGPVVADNPRFKKDHEELRALNPEFAAEIEVKIEQMKQEKAAA